MPPQIRRNDPCPCGSGKKYKQCCLARERQAQAERAAWRKVAQHTRAALIALARGPAFAADVGLGLGRFWQDRYKPENVGQMSADESLRFFDWFAHDHLLEATEVDAERGRRLIEVYRDRSAHSLDEQAKALVDAWIESPPGSAFTIAGCDAAQGTVELSDLFLHERRVTVEDGAAAKHGQVGQILLARPLPEHERVVLSGATVLLPAAEREGLCAFVDAAWEGYLAERAQATMAEFLRHRAYLLTHYALEWADREGRPDVAANRPGAGGGRAKIVRTLVKRSQTRVQRR